MQRLIRNCLVTVTLGSFLMGQLSPPALAAESAMEARKILAFRTFGVLVGSLKSNSEQFLLAALIKGGLSEGRAKKASQYFSEIKFSAVDAKSCQFCIRATGPDGATSVLEFSDISEDQADIKVDGRRIHLDHKFSPKDLAQYFQGLETTSLFRVFENEAHAYGPILLGFFVAIVSLGLLSVYRNVSNQWPILSGKLGGNFCCKLASAIREKLPQMKSLADRCVVDIARVFSGEINTIPDANKKLRTKFGVRGSYIDNEYYSLFQRYYFEKAGVVSKPEIQSFLARELLKEQRNVFASCKEVNGEYSYSKVDILSREMEVSSAVVNQKECVDQFLAAQSQFDSLALYSSAYAGCIELTHDSKLLSNKNQDFEGFRSAKENQEKYKWLQEDYRGAKSSEGVTSGVAR